MLAIHDLSIAYGRRTIFEHVDLVLDPARSCAIMGASGSGKSTILAAILGYVKPRTGSIALDGRSMGALRPRDWREIRRHMISAVYQQGELIGELTPAENIAIAPLIGGQSHRESYRRAHELLEELGLPTTAQPSSTLSGGEQQRVAVARALATRPRLILADEPTASLDAENRTLVGDLLLSIPQRWGCSVLLSTHDAELAELTDDAYSLTPQEGGASAWSQMR